jgi:hypothetical protein
MNEATPEEQSATIGTAAFSSTGGQARAQALTPEQRSAIAKGAANKRWRKHFEDQAAQAPGARAPDPQPADDGIRQYHGVGVNGSSEPFLMWEGEKFVHLGKGTGIFSSAVTPLNARYVADRLYELARRIEQRTQP